MTDLDIHRQLENIASGPDFAWASAELVDAWGAAGVGVEVVEPFLRFMESHPEIIMARLER